MADRVRGTGIRVVGGLVVAVVALVGACSSDGTPDGGEDAGADWLAAELPEVPDGMLVCSVDEFSSVGRRVAYGSIAEGVGDNCEVTITASTSYYGWNVDEAIEFARENSTRPVTVSDLDGHRAMVGPMTDEGRVYGQRVVWEQAPGLVITVEDARYGGGEPVATEESALAFAGQVVGMDRARWDEAVADFDASYEYSGPPEGSTPRVLAEGEVDGRPWTLSAWVGEQPSGFADLRCLHLSYGGDDTGPGCATQWEVLDGTGFVIGWTGADAGDPLVQSAPTVAGDVADLDLTRVEADTFPVDGAPGPVWVAVLPAGSCTVTVGDAPFPGASPTALWLLPGAPGAAACAAT